MRDTPAWVTPSLQLHLVRAILFLLILLEFWILSQVKPTLDRVLLGLAIVAQAVGVALSYCRGCTSPLWDGVVGYTHHLFGILMCTVPFLARSRQLLALHVGLGVFTLTTRRLMNTCVYRVLYGTRAIPLDPRMDLVFTVMVGVSMVRLWGHQRVPRHSTSR